MSDPRAIVLASLSSLGNAQLARHAIDEFDEIAKRFYIGDLRPSELSGGRFAEAVFRICEQVCFGNHTPVGKQLTRVDQLIQRFEQTPASKADDSFRLHIPRALRSVYDFRNKRDVAHLGSTINPNFADASLIIAVAGWVMAELVRIGHKCPPDQAQTLVDGLVERRVPLVWNEGQVLRVLNPSLSYKEKTMLLLYHFDPDYVPEQTLFDGVEHSRIDNYRSKVLRPLHDAALIDYRDGRARILPPGLRYVEDVLKDGER